MRLLVTGGYGFIGSNLVRMLLGPGGAGSGVAVERLVVLDKMTYAANPENLADLESDPRLRPVRGDIGDAPLLDRLFAEHDFDAVLHLAAESHVDRSIDAALPFLETNVVGTFQLLEAARRHQSRRGAARHFRFIHISTDEVYGSLAPDAAPFTEQSPYAPNNPYAASKAAADHLVRACHRTHGLPVVTTNCSNNYGPRQFPEKLIPLMISRIRAGDPLPLYGDGLQVRDWLHVEDHCRALLRVLVVGGVGEVYNIGGRCELTNLEVVNRLIDLINEHLPPASRRDPQRSITHVPDRPGHDRRYAIDGAKIERDLGWRPRETAASGFRDTVRWYLENQAWVDRILSGTYRGERLGAAP